MRKMQVVPKNTLDIGTWREGTADVSDGTMGQKDSDIVVVRAV